MSREPEEKDILLPFEIRHISGDHKEYYKIKRHNLFSSIQRFSSLWDLFGRLDEVWIREIQDVRVATDADRFFPMMLYINAHAKIRISMELAMSACLGEANSVMRDGIECAAHAHYMLSDPALQVVWLSKNDNEEEFDKRFKANKRAQVFKGLENLHRAFSDLCDMGSHPTINSLSGRVTVTQTASHLELRLNYSGCEEKEGVMAIFSLLLFAAEMEQIFFKDYETRFHLDEKLLNMRRDFVRRKEQVRQAIIQKYDVKSILPA